MGRDLARRGILLLLCFSTGKVAPAPSPVLPWTLLPAQQHARPSPRAGSKRTRGAREMPRPDSLLPAMAPPPLPTPNFSLVTTETLNSPQRLWRIGEQTQRRRQEDAMTHAEAGRAGAVPPHTPIPLLPGPGRLPYPLLGRRSTFSCHVTCHCEERVGCRRPAPLWTPSRPRSDARGGGTRGGGERSSRVSPAATAGLEFPSIIVFQGWLYYLRFVHVTL